MKPLTPEQLAEARAAIKRAHQEIGQIARKGRDRWRMAIPAQPDRDSDLILSTGLNAGEQALTEVERQRRELEYTDRLGHQIIRAEAGAVRDLEATVARLTRERDQARSASADYRADRDQAQHDYARLVDGIAAIERDRDQVCAERNEAERERDEAVAELDALRARIAAVPTRTLALDDGTELEAVHPADLLDAIGGTA